MDRAIPEINRHTAARIRQEHKYKHKDHVRNAKGRVDNSLPESMYHPIVKHKKEQMIEGKSNRLVLLKILEIYSHNRFLMVMETNSLILCLYR